MEGRESVKRNRGKNNNNNNKNKTKKTKLNNTIYASLPVISEENNEENENNQQAVRFDEPFSDNVIGQIVNMAGASVSHGSFGKTERISLFGRSFIKKISLLTDMNGWNNRSRFLERIFDNEVSFLTKVRGDTFFPFLYGSSKFQAPLAVERKNTDGTTKKMIITARYGLMVMEDIVGIDLFDLADSGRGFLKAEAQVLRELIINAVIHLHSLHYIHLDIKPENMIVRMHNNVILGIVLIDFGFVKYTKGPTTNLPIFFTPRYAQEDLKKKFALRRSILKTRLTPGNSFTYNPNLNKGFHYKYTKNDNVYATKETLQTTFTADLLKNNVDTGANLASFNIPTQPRFNEDTVEQSLMNCINTISALYDTNKVPASSLNTFVNRIVRAKAELNQPHTTLVSTTVQPSIVSSTTTSLSTAPQLSLFDLVGNVEFSLDQFKQQVSSASPMQLISKNHENLTLLDILNLKIEELEEEFNAGIAMPTKMYNTKRAILKKYKDARDFLQNRFILVGGSKRKTRKQRKRRS